MAKSARHLRETTKLGHDPIDIGLGLFHARKLRGLRTKSTWKTYDREWTLRGMGKSVPQTLQELRKRAGFSMNGLAREMGYRGASSIQRYLSDDLFNETYLALETARRFSDALAGRGSPPISETDVLALAGPEVVAGSRQVPEIDFVQAGGWHEITDPYPAGEGAAWVAVTSKVGRRAYALRVLGRSMEPVYFERDHIIVDPDVDPVPGDDVIAKLTNEQMATFKRYRQKTPKEIELFPLNSLHGTLTINADNEGKIVGVVVEHHRYRAPTTSE